LRAVLPAMPVPRNARAGQLHNIISFKQLANGIAEGSRRLDCEACGGDAGTQH
jgi:hypothetical protein